MIALGGRSLVENTIGGGVGREGRTGDSGFLEVFSWFTLWCGLISLSNVSFTPLPVTRRRGQLTYLDGSFRVGL